MPLRSQWQKYYTLLLSFNRMRDKSVFERLATHSNTAQPHTLDEISPIVATIKQRGVQSTSEKVLLVQATTTIADQAWITRLQVEADGFPVVFTLMERRTNIDQNHATASSLWRRRSVGWARSAPCRFDRAGFAKCPLPNGRRHHERLWDSPYPSPFSNVDRQNYLRRRSRRSIVLAFSLD